MRKANQGGSVLSFVAIGIILVLLLIGGTYAVRQKLFVSAANDSGSSQTTDTPKKEPSRQTDTSKDKEPVKEDPAKNPDSPQPAQPQPDNSQQSTIASSPANLPQTGPVETLGIVLGAAFLTAALTAYTRSRRAYTSL